MENQNIIVYTNQTNVVLDKIMSQGTCFCKREYIEKKYEESASVFLTPYTWFVNEAQNICKSPEGAEYPYWVFDDIGNVDTSGDGNLLELSIPRNEIVLFDMFDWIKIMQMHYVGTSIQEEQEFSEEVKKYGCDEFKIVTTNFYPALKSKLMNSWKNLFRHHANLINENKEDVRAVQGAIWQIKKEWITSKK